MVSQSGDNKSFVELSLLLDTLPYCYFVDINNVTCNGMSDGSATVSGSGGVPSYDFLWSNGEIADVANGLYAGVYAVTIIDAFFEQGVCSVTITEPNYLSSYISTEGNMLQANAYGGTPPYSYFWFSGDTTQLIPMTDFGCNCAITIFDAHNCYTSICPSCYTDLQNSIEINILFNQTTNSLYLENSQFYYLEIYNIAGAKLLETKCTEQSSSIDISSFVNGTYIVKAFKDNSFVYKKICIVR